MNHATHNTLSSIGLLILRLGVGGYLVTHGWPKFQQVMAGDFDNFPDLIGIGSAGNLILITLAEFVCALLVMAGAFTRLAAVPVVIGLGVAAFVVHGGDPWTMNSDGPSKEPALLYVIPFLALVFTGAGRLSVDALLMPKLLSRRAKAAAA